MRTSLLGGCVIAIGVASVAFGAEIPNVTTTPSHTPTPTTTPSQTPTPTVTPTQTATPAGPVTPRPTPWVAGSPEFAVNSYTTADQIAPVVAVRAGDGFVIAWTSYLQDGDSGGVFARRFDAGGTALGGEFEVNTTTAGMQYKPAVASDSAGNFVVAWASQVGPGQYTDVFARRYDSAGAPLGDEFQVNVFTTGYQTAPEVAMTDSGFVVVWASAPFQSQPSQDGDQSGVYSRRYDADGNSITGDVLVNSTTAGSQQAPSVSMNASGAAVVAWESTEQDGDLTGIYAQRFDGSGTPAGSEFQVNTYTTNYQLRPDVAVGPAGDFVVVWSSENEDSSLSGIFSRAYDLTGAPVGPGLQVNTYTTSGQSRPRVAKDPTFPGGMVVVWDSAGQEDPAGFPG